MPLAPLLVVAFLIVPLLEIWIIIEVGQVIGGWPTLALLVLESLLGAYLVRREGRRTWRTLRLATSSGRLPGNELLDGALVLVGGTLLLTPGFLTDVLGFFLILPLTRPVARRIATMLIASRTRRGGLLLPFLLQPPGGRGRQGPAPSAEGRVVESEVIEDSRERRGD